MLRRSRPPERSSRSSAPSVCGAAVIVVSNSFKQNTKQWYAWRDQGLGASDAPSVMGLSPWTTAFELWAVKAKLMPKPEANAFAVAAMQRGRDMEPDMIRWYEQKTGKTVTRDVNVEHPTHPFLRASLDGWVGDEQTVVEGKCPGKTGLEEAKSMRVPKAYLAQVYMQLAVTGASKLDFVTYAGKGTGYFDGEDGIITTIRPDFGYQEELVRRMVAFWQAVQTKTAPEVTQKDLDRLDKQLKPVQDRLSTMLAFRNLLTSLLPQGSVGTEGSGTDSPAEED